MCSYCEPETEPPTPEESVDILRGVLTRIDELTKARDEWRKRADAKADELRELRKERTCICRQRGASVDCPVHGASAHEINRAYRQASKWQEIATELRAQLRELTQTAESFVEDDPEAKTKTVNETTVDPTNWTINRFRKDNDL